MEAEEQDMVIQYNRIQVLFEEYGRRNGERLDGSKSMNNDRNEGDFNYIL
jgi:hypothetical protein